MYRGVYQLPAIERVIFGRSAAETIVEEVSRLAVKRVFVLAALPLLEATDVVTRIVSALGKLHVGTWSRVAPHTPREDIIGATAAARSVRTELIVTIGGGSITDAGKVVQTALANGVTRVDELDALRKLPDAPMTAAREGVTAPQTRMIAVPTTLAGAELTPYAGVTNMATGVKEVFTHPLQVPRTVILDPAVTIHTPEWLWLSTGIRALDHAVEDICSVDAQPFSEGTALQAIRLLNRALSATRRDATDLRARLDAQMAMWLSSVGAQAGVSMGASHAIGHALGGTAGVPHGYTSCIMMPHVMRFNEPFVRAEQALIAEALGDRDSRAADLVERLIERLGLPQTLRAVSVTSDLRVEAVARAAMQDPWMKTNPRPIESVEQVKSLLLAARG